MATVLETYNKINNILKQHGKSNEFKQQFCQLTEEEKSAVKALKKTQTLNKQKERTEKEKRVDKALEQYLDSNSSTTSEDNNTQIDKEKATEIVNKMHAIIKELNSNIINK